MPQKKARIKDIASLAGVSIGTVDRVIHNRGEVAEGTRLKVQKFLRDTDYSPNLMARVLKSKKRFHLVSLLPEPTSDNSFWYNHNAGIRRAVEELSLFPVTLTQITFNILNEADFQQKSQIVLIHEPDGVMLAPIFKTESSVFCSKLSKENIPFAFIDLFLEDTDFISYTGENIFQSGRVAGQLLDIITPADKDILIVTIARNIQNVHHLNIRTKGFLSYFEKLSLNRGRRININIPDPSSESVSASLDEAFRKNPFTGAIFVTGSRSYLIANYLEGKKLSGINLIGYDIHDMNVKYLKSGYIKFLIGQRPDEQTYKGIKKLFEYLTLDKIPERMEYLPVDIITSENVDFFVEHMISNKI